jgi:SpoVK/Ycf46/Vps4 family AAA+-type ATPase
VWIDEIEKGLASSTSDDGVSKRVLGSFLTWMAEHKSGVFLVATANAIDQLPPELLRKGRFDEIFFVDLPKPDVREAVLGLHLKRRKVDVDGWDFAPLVQASEGFSGAEIEQAVVSALYAAHGAGEPMDAKHVLQEMQHTKPLSVLMSEQVNALREWASTRTVAAD